MNEHSRRVVHSSNKHDWETPEKLFRDLNEVFNFSLDACATAKTAKCSNFISPEQDAMVTPWSGTVWCNPPYGRELPKWLKRGIDQLSMLEMIVYLIPARTETNYWHELIWPKAKYVLFLHGRIHFLEDGVTGDAAPFPSALVIYEGDEYPWHQHDQLDEYEALRHHGVVLNLERGML